MKSENQNISNQQSNKNNNQKYAKIKELFNIGVAAFSSSIFVQIFFHPLDVLKVRFQNGIRQIKEQEGWKGLYKGAIASIVSQSLARVLFFTCYELRKNTNQSHYNNHHLVVIKSSTESSLFSLLFVQPLFVMKNRLILDVTKQNGYSSAIENIKEIISSHSYKGFYRGLSLSLVLSSHGIILMYSYEMLKVKLERLDRQFQPLVSGVLSKCLASTVLYPVATLRTRIQQKQYQYLSQGRLVHQSTSKYTSITHCFHSIYINEGLQGFYKGYVCNIIKSVPSKGFFFYFYEYFKSSIITNH